MTDYTLAAFLTLAAGAFVAVAAAAWTAIVLVAALVVAAVCAWIAFDLIRQAARWRAVDRDDRDYLSGRTLDRVRREHRRWDP